MMMWLSVMLLSGCRDYDIPAANGSLLYPDGEAALDASPYVSARPSVKSDGTATFSIDGVKHDGVSVDSSMAGIDPETGVVTLMFPSGAASVGEYLVSVAVTSDGNVVHYPDVLRVVVRGICFEEPSVVLQRGEELLIPADKVYLAQTEGTLFALDMPEETSVSYAGISLDPRTCAVSVSADTDAGVYPISIRATNLTNPEGALFSDVLTLTVESKPYALSYDPASITLVPKEGHVSPRPTVRAMSVTQGERVSYSLEEDYDLFSIDAESGVITLPGDLDLVSDAPKSYALQVNVANDKGTSAFPEIYTVTIDPDKQAEPVTGVTYPGVSMTDGVSLASGEPWVSEAPRIEGSTVGIEWSVEDAPQGVGIDRKSGVVTLDAGHHVAFGESVLKIRVKNQGMAEPYLYELPFKVDPVIWQVKLGTNSASNTLVNSGISNMDRFSFLGKMYPSSATSIQVKLGWGKSTSGNYIDANGGSNPEGETVGNQNNDWLVSEEIDLQAFRHRPVLKFRMTYNYGKAENNLLGCYIVAIDEQTSYSYDPMVDQEQSDRAGSSVDSTPCGLPFVGLADAAPLVPTTSAGWNNFADYELPIPDTYKGKRIRIALRYWNPSDNVNNSRTYRIEDSLRIEDKLVD